MWVFDERIKDVQCRSLQSPCCCAGSSSTLDIIRRAATITTIHEPWAVTELGMAALRHLRWRIACRLAKEFVVQQRLAPWLGIIHVRSFPKTNDWKL